MRKKIALLLVCLLAILPLTAFADSFTMAGYDDGSSTGHDWNNNFFFLRMNERTGVDFTFNQYQTADAWKDAKKGYLKGENLPDVLFKADLGPTETQKLYEAGVLIDLKPYIQENMPNLSALLAANPAWEKAITLPDGAIPALPSINPLQINNAIWINTQWLARVKREMPTTADELTEVLRLFQNGDPNQNAKKDEIPMTFTGMWDLRYLQHAFGIVSDDYYVEIRDGAVQETVTSDANRAFLTWLHQLWEERLIDHNGFMSLDTVRAITDEKAAITYGVVFGSSALLLVPANEIGNYDVVMPMTGSEPQRYRSLLGDLTRGTFAVTKACADPAAMLRWVDYLYSEEGCFLAQAGELEKEYEMHSDGTWSWIGDASEVANVVMKEYTIASGAPIPGYVSNNYQLNYDDSATHRAVMQLAELTRVSEMPYPPVFYSAAQQARLNALWAEIGPYCETAMAQFVTGDIELNDATWADFCAQTKKLGMDEVVAIMQEALK